MSEHVKYKGAWMTDIDDTLIRSGEFPSDEWILGLSETISALKRHNILWVPMSGVAIVKLGSRILYRLSKDLCSHIFYYGGDGSLKYYLDESSGQWQEDDSFSRLFTDAQAIMIIGEEEYREALQQLNDVSNEPKISVDGRIEAANKILEENGYKSEQFALSVLKSKLADNGHDPSESETYFRGGSVSWMMLGDISADPYHEEKNLNLRMELIRISREWLNEHGGLADLGSAGITVPFPGARGIKFVLEGNNKERASRELMQWSQLEPQQILFAGNELFNGGNDNMIRNIEGVTLLSVGDHEDDGEYVIPGLITQKGNELSGIESNSWWMNYAVSRLDNGDEWSEILKSMRDFKG